MSAHTRHGDVLLSRTDRKAKGKKLRKLTIALGEATGHHHTLYADEGSHIIGTPEHFEVVGTARLKHQEHAEVVLPSGTFVTSMEREYDPWSEEINKVVD